MFLDETQCVAKKHHDRYYDGDALIAREERRRRERQQKQVQRVDRAGDQFAEDRVARW
jgi:hypothetical protein